MNKILPLLLTLSVLFFFSTDMLAQGKGKGKGKPAPAMKAKPGAKAKPGKKGPPPWAPAHGYRQRHVYFPDHHAYYDNTAGVYISLSGGNWTTSVNLPLSLKGIDLKVAAKVEIDFDGTSPQVNFNTHKSKHPGKKAKVKVKMK